MLSWQSWRWIRALARRLGATTAQATVLLALGSTVLVGFTGLALDGGLAAAQQRVAQNAADAAALAATQEIAAGTTSQNTIYNRINEYAVTKNRAWCSGGTCQSFTATYVKKSDGTLGSSVGTSGSAPGDCKGVCVTVTTDYSPMFMRILGVNTIHTSATSCAQSTTAGQCLGGYALWANGETSGCNEINVSSQSVTVNGNAWTNGDISTSAAAGTPLVINGNLSYVDSKSGNITVTGTTTDLTAASSWGFNGGTAPYTFSNYTCTVSGSTCVPSSTNAYAYAAMNDTSSGHSATSYTVSGEPAGSYNVGHYHYINGNWTVPNNFVLDGLYYVNGDVGVSGTCDTSSPCSPFTLVTSGGITWSVGNATLNPYSGGLTLFSNESGNCSSAVTNLSGTGTHFNGVLYAPSGMIQLSGSTSTQYQGSVIANNVKVTAGVTISYDSAYCPVASQSTGTHLMKQPS